MRQRAALFLSVFMLAFYGAAAGGELPRVHGFAENAFGLKLEYGDTKHRNYNMLEQRLQLKSSYFFSGKDLWSHWRTNINFKGDFLVDEHFGGKTDFDLREFNAVFSPKDYLDIRIGRQVLTWGTGDYIFINDAFPKDYVSFYIGRDDEYLKVPSDALRISLYPQPVNIDFVAIGHFTPNILPEGDRLSAYDPFQNRIAGRDSSQQYWKEPYQRGENIQYALRLYRNFSSNEAALYYYRGFDESPSSYANEAAHELFYERLDIYGCSLRGPFLSGIANFEAGYFHSPQDSSGSNRLVKNSSVQALLGYEKDLGNDLKLGFQYLYEQMLDYSQYHAALTPQDLSSDEHRHLLTNRITKLFKNQTVELSLFNFYSPSDQDGYFRGYLAYNINDRWKATFGANIPWGAGFTSDFASMKKNKNIYLRLRYGF
ncbi:MAG: hypothetical protein PHS09_04310 [Candidatus Omnitrophica bacterium]|nr:hypothetical protein [Candidatus Omnitrophota bacterium]